MRAANQVMFFRTFSYFSTETVGRKLEFNSPKAGILPVAFWKRREDKGVDCFVCVCFIRLVSIDQIYLKFTCTVKSCYKLSYHPADFTEYQLSIAHN